MTSLTEQYRQMHAAGHFPGNSTAKWLPHLKALAEKHKPKSVLDYGCGKGLQWTRDKLHEQIGIPMPTLYDPGVPEFSSNEMLVDIYDLVICTDVMEHLEGYQIKYAFKRMAYSSGSAAFIAITCRPAKKLLPDGRNCHLTIKPPMWWRGYAAGAADWGDVDLQLEFEE